MGTTHPRTAELPETFRHPRHYWIFDLPEIETKLWLWRFKDCEEGRREHLAGRGRWS